MSELPPIAYLSPNIDGRCGRQNLCGFNNQDFIKNANKTTQEAVEALASEDIDIASSTVSCDGPSVTRKNCVWSHVCNAQIELRLHGNDGVIESYNIPVEVNKEDTDSEEAA